ncbi:hypothetical protein BH10PAT3_BH10PAT3_6290 [soil metagenome]
MPKRRTVSKRKKPLVMPHSHTGRRLAHRHTGYLPLLFVIIFSGFMLAGVTQTARASDIVVRAKVPAELPPSPATITSPGNTTIFTAIPIEVEGTCPDGYLVKLYRNNLFSGSTLCNTCGTFNILSDLSEGTNLLETRIYNVTDDEGPSSPGVVVTYSPPLIIAPENPGGLPSTTESSTPRPKANETIPQLLIFADAELKTTILGNELTWELEIKGGSKPFALNIDWGDGTSMVIVRKEEGKFSVSHSYHRLSLSNNSFTVRINASDDSGQNAFVQLTSIIKSPLYSSANTTTFGSSIWKAHPQKVLWFIYFSLLIMVGCVWLGEQRAYHDVSERIKTPKLKAHHK